MIGVRTKRVVAIIRGDDLHVFAVRGGVGGGISGETVIHGFLDASIERCREEMSRVDHGGLLTVVCPSRWCAVRPLQIEPATWSASVDQLRASLDQLVPMSADDASIGMVSLAPAADSAARGSALIAVRKAMLDAWLEPIEMAIGRGAREVISTHMAILGLDLDAAVDVFERGTGSGNGGPLLVHQWAGSGFASLAQPTRGRSIDMAGDALLAVGASSTAPQRDVMPGDLAVAAASIDDVAIGLYQPLRGVSTSIGRRLIVPALVGAAAVALALASGVIFSQRAETGLERLRADVRDVEERVAEAQEVQRSAEATISLVRDAVIEPTKHWSSVLPVLSAVSDAIGDEGFVYRLDISDESVSIRGEASEASAVLERLERNPLFESARFNSSISTMGDAGREVFEVSAARAIEPPAADTNRRQP